MTEKEEKEIDEKIDKMAAEMEREMAEREKEMEEADKAMAEMEREMAEREKEMEEADREMNQILREMLVDINTPLCHHIKPDGVMGREFMVENMLLRHCVGCNDEGQCWSYGQLKDLIKEESKTLLNQDF